jgi:hypothetical protein
MCVGLARSFTPDKPRVIPFGEYLGGSSMSVHDTSFAVYFADDDAVIECGACDPEYGEPEGWPEWVDADRWEPTPDDVAWLNHEPYQPTDQDWDDLFAASYGFGDDDIQAAGLPVG